MSDTIASLGPAADSTYGQGQHPKHPADADNAADSEPTEPSDSADLRLVIEDDRGDGAPIYKTLDRRTGKIVRTLERDQLLEMREADNYVAGQVIKTRV